MLKAYFISHLEEDSMGRYRVNKYMCDATSDLARLWER